MKTAGKKKRQTGKGLGRRASGAATATTPLNGIIDLSSDHRQTMIAGWWPSARVLRPDFGGVGGHQPQPPPPFYPFYIIFQFLNFKKI